MKLRFRAVPLLALLALAGAASAETLLIERVQQETEGRHADARHDDGPGRRPASARRPTASTRAAARSTSGRRSTAGAIPTFTVYFEKNKVIDAVANKADAERDRPEAADPLSLSPR